MKKIKVYASEMKDGLENIILANQSFAYTSSAELSEAFDISKFEQSIKAQAGEGVSDSHILYHLKSIMVSTGANKNDDVFVPVELYKARHTPEDKPFNLEHQDDVIGHITSQYCIAADGSVLDDNLSDEDIPDEFHVVTSAVVYKEWKEQKNIDRVEELIKEISLGKYSVSMECLLSNFDYMLIENDGTEKAIASIVPRKRDTAYLTKHLRVYGGTGIYEGKKVKRVLRNIMFSGKGLVRKPANPSSVILQEDVSATASLVYTNMSENKESSMAENNTLEKENADLKSKLENLQASVREKNEVELKAQATKFQTEVKELTDKNSTLKAELDKVSASLNDVSKVKAEYEVRLAKLDEEKKTTERVASVASSLELDNEKASKIVASVIKLGDEEFTSWLKTLAEYEAEKKAMYQASVPATAGSGGDPMAKGGKTVNGKPTEPTPIAVITTPGAGKKYGDKVVNLANGTKPVNLPAGVTASEVVDPAEPNTETPVDAVVPANEPALVASFVDEKVESTRANIANFFGIKKESK